MSATTSGPTSTPAALSFRLNLLARRFADAADRADTVDNHARRSHEAATLRLAAAFVATSVFTIEHGRDWLISGTRVADGYDCADMDAVHASRAGRRVTS